MSPEYSEKKRFEQRLNLETTVVLREDKYYPASFQYNEQKIEVRVVTAARTETRKSWSGEVFRNYFVVKTDQGSFELKHDEVKRTWTLVGKLNE